MAAEEVAEGPECLSRRLLDDAAPDGCCVVRDEVEPPVLVVFSCCEAGICALRDPMDPTRMPPVEWPVERLCAFSASALHANEHNTMKQSWDVKASTLHVSADWRASAD